MKKIKKIKIIEEDSPIIISTWQSIYKLDKKWFEKFDVVVGDECLSPDTLITMKNGNKKAIKDIIVGEKVLTFNETTKKLENKKVIKIHKNISRKEKLFRVTLSNKSFIKITGNHKVLLYSGIWKRVDELQLGDIPNNIKAHDLKVTAIEEIDNTTDTYNLHIEDNHNYYANGINVSNCHIFKSKSLISIMTKLHNTKFRYGFTGTLDGSQTHKWVLEGLFGPSYKVIQTKELMEKGHISTLDIKCLVLKHSPQKFETYEDEIQFIINNKKRNNFISNLSLSLKGNSLVLYTRVDTHGIPLYELINSKKNPDKKVFFISGGVDTKDREEIREIVEKEDNAIIVASYGVYSTGINIKNLHNVVFASPYKSRIKILQSIGRGLRKSSNKDKAMLYDISDDCTHNSKKNYTLNHLIERIKIYNEESFNYEIYTIKVEE